MPVLLFSRGNHSYYCIIVSIQQSGWIRRASGELSVRGNQLQESQVMAKKATAKVRSGGTKTKSKPRSRAVAERRSDDGGRRSSDAGMGDAFIKLLQSPLVADLVAVAA